MDNGRVREINFFYLQKKKLGGPKKKIINPVFVDGLWASMVETGYMSLLGEIGAAARYHLYGTHPYFYFFYFFFRFAPCPTKLRLQRAPGELAESSH